MAQANPFLKEDLEKLKPKNQEKSADEILVMAALDLKSPLGAVRTAVDLLGQFSTAPEIHHLIELIQKNSEAALSMVDNILAIEHLRPPVFRLHSDWHQLHDILEQAKKEAALLAEDNNIRIEVHASPVSLSCDRAAILQVLGHVLNCAVRFSPENSSIIIDSQLISKQVQISVTDRGPAPVSDEFRSSRPGFGLCLEIARLLVSAHGGTFNFNSNNGHTRFYFTLPLST